MRSDGPLARPVHWTGVARAAAVVTPPSPMAAWVACLLHQVARNSAGEFAIEEIRENQDFTPPDGERRVYFGHVGVAVEALLCAQSFPVVAVLDDVDVSVAFMCENGTPAFDAIRVHSAAYALAPALRDNPAALIVARASPLTGVEMADAILAHIGVELTAQARREALGWLGLAPESELSFDAAVEKFCIDYNIEPPDVANLSTQVRNWILAILIPMLRLAWPGKHPPMEWPIDALLLPVHDTPAPPSLPLAGPPRCLIYGPYVYVPRGRYQIEFVIGLSKPIGARLFAMELFDDHCIARAEIRLPSDGVYRGRFYFEQKRPEIRLSIRLLMLESAIEGRLSLAHVRLHRLETQGEA